MACSSHCILFFCKLFYLWFVVLCAILVNLVLPEAPMTFTHCAPYTQHTIWLEAVMVSFSSLSIL
jgi:hypothetical protein